MDSVAMCNGIDISALDDRRYECIELANSLQVLLISDPTTEKASAAMDVHVGHQSDPAELPGLAHFLEHMLFLGTTKYPDENSYKQYLSAHSGRSNASTSQMHTNYYFDVLSDHFEEALDRFAQFFIAPLFTPSATEREMHAVDAENAKNLQNDHRRLYQLEKSLSNPAHPFSKFGTGNIETLGHGPKANGVDVRAALLAFHETYYSASIMKLVILGKEDLATLAAWATRMFSAVRNTGRSFPTFGAVVPFDASRLARRVHVAPVKDLRTIAIAWPLESLYWEYLTKPSKILSHLFGHEGKGSLLSYLKRQKWANGLTAGLTRDNEDWSLFSVKVDATDLGIAHADDVVTAVYEYVHLLQKKAPFPRWIFDETQAIGLVAFRFKSKETPMSYTSYLAGVMHRYPTKYIVSGGHLLYGYDAGKVQEILDGLTPSRMRLTVVSKTFDGATESVEKWFSTPYTEAAIPAATLARWTQARGNRALHLPHRNEFICSDFAIVTPLPSVTDAAFESTPELVAHSESSRLWYKPDTQFRKPKLSLSFQLFSPVVTASPYHAVLTSLFIRYVKDELTECAYDAELAGMSYDVAFNARGVELSVGGFSHKLATLLFKVLSTMLSMTKPTYVFQDDVFARVKDRTKRMYANFGLEEPYQHAVYSASLVLEATKWSIDDKIAAIERLGIHDVAAYAQTTLFQQVFVEGFVYGNITRTDASALMARVVQAFGIGTTSPRQSLPILPSQAQRARVVQLRARTEYVYARREWNAENLNSSVCTLYQVAAESMGLRARLELFAHLFREPCFNRLRTQEQLGYLVFSGLLHTEGIEYFRILIQSNTASPAYLDQRIEAFVASFRTIVASLTPNEWRKHVNAVVKALVEKPKRESEEAMRFWREIANETYVFDRRARVAALVATLHPSDLVAFFDEYISAAGSKRSKLSIQLYGAAHAFPALASGDDAVAPAQLAALSSSAATGVAAAMQLGDLYVATAARAPAAVEVIRDIDDFKRRMPLFPERARDGLAAAMAGTTATSSAKL